MIKKSLIYLLFIIMNFTILTGFKYTVDNPANKNETVVQETTKPITKSESKTDFSFGTMVLFLGGIGFLYIAFSGGGNNSNDNAANNGQNIYR